MTGTVVTYHRGKGWGWIAPDVAGNDVFVHISQLPKDHKWLAEGERVSFDLEERNGRSHAANVQIIAEAQAVQS